MNSRNLLVLITVVALVGLAGCAKDKTVATNPSYDKSGRKHQGDVHEIKFFNRWRKTPGTAVGNVPLATDPDYQEYLEWKRWKEFKEYEMWKKENPEPADSTGQNTTS